MGEQTRRIGFACAYTPLPLIHAAGYVPHRILPTTEVPDAAGSLLHDNLCPHVKRVLDRALAGDLPRLQGVVYMNSCDAMRRLADAWRTARPDDRTAMVDLPFAHDAAAAEYLAGELGRFRDTLREWSGAAVEDETIAASIELYHELALALSSLQQRAARGTLSGAALQTLHNRSVTEPPEAIRNEAQGLLAEPETEADDGAVPLYLFGNVLPDAEAFELFERCGARVKGDDLCTGSRQLAAEMFDPSSGTPLEQLARSLLSRPACARTITADRPGELGPQVLAAAREAGAAGVIAYVMKFCDPYLGRMPRVREELGRAGLPLLVLEGDCTMRSLGQQQTRIEAFVEMLGGSP